MNFTLSPKKKVIISLSVIVVILLISGFIFGGPIGKWYEKPPTDPTARKQWLSEKIVSGSKDTINLDHKVPSWKELKEMNESLPKRSEYPKFLKALQTYGPEANTAEVLYFGDVLKDLGVNTYFIHAAHHFKGGSLKLFYPKGSNPMLKSQDEAKRTIVHTIILARQQGLAVVLFPDYHDLEDGGMERLGVSNDLEEKLKKISLEYAQIAEEYNVEYFVPVNQIEAILFSNNYPVDEIVERTNTFYADVIPEVKEIYTGKIMYKMGGLGDWDPYENISLEGADIFGFTGCYNSNNHDLDFVTADIKAASATAGKLSKKYGIPWINAEFVITDQQSQNNMGSNTKEYSIEEYYQIGISGFNKYAVPQGAIGFTVHSLLMDGKVYDTPAFPVIKDFFASKP
jgi:hypothetical protein